MKSIAVKPSGLEACPVKPELAKRTLISPHQAAGLAAVFKVLASDTRLRLLHVLVKTGEICVSDLSDSVGMAPQAVSNQLQRLVDRGIVASRRDGVQIFYKVVDPCVVALLDQGLCLVEDARQGKGRAL